VPEHQLGIQKLPTVAGRLATGRIYVVLHDVELGRQVVRDTLLAANLSNQAIWLADSSSSNGKWAQALADAHRLGSLKIFNLTDSDQADFAERLLQELDFIAPVAGSLVLVDGVDRLLERAGEHWGSVVIAWQKWAERKKCTVLWMCPMRPGKPAPIAEMTRLAHCFSGLARLRKFENEIRYDVFYWFSDEGLLTNKSFRLAPDANGKWEVLDADAKRVSVGEKPADEDDVFAMRAVLPEGRTEPVGWRLFETAEQMMGALGSAHACTVVFYYHVGSPIEVLARIIFDLRRSIGSQIKIVVKEAGGQLRKNNELLLLSVGVNLLISNEIGFTRMVDQLRLLQGRIYSAQLSADFETAIASLKSGEELGYLSADHFVRVVSAGLTKIRNVQVPNVLIILPITEGVAILEALKSCTMRRAGDLFTADNQTVYVFLSACEEQDVTVTLDRIFRLPVAVIFASETRMLTQEDIRIALADLSSRVEQNQYPDWTLELRQFAEESAKANVTDSTPSRRRVAPQRALAATPFVIKLRTAQQEPEWELI
jgi:cellulose biosynthesis protein BcsE